MLNSRCRHCLTAALFLSAICGVSGCQFLRRAAPDAPTASRPAESPLAPLAWLAGAWAHTAEDGTRIEEYWTAPAGDSMLGLSRTIVGGATREFEFLRIAPLNGKVTYLASPGGRHPPTAFELLDSSASVLVFQNARHDFPRRIIYERAGRELHVRLEGEERGESRVLEFRYHAAEKGSP